MTADSSATTRPGADLYISGVSLFTNAVESLDAFENMLYTGKQPVETGARKPAAPGEALVRVCRAALEDAGITASGAPVPAGLLVLPNSIGPQLPAAPAGMWLKLAGPVKNLPAGTGLAEGLAQAQALLAGSTLEAVILAAQTGGQGTAIAVRSTGRAYARLSAVVHGSALTAGEAGQLTSEALRSTGLKTRDIGLLEYVDCTAETVFRSASPALQGLLAGYHNGTGKLTCALSQTPPLTQPVEETFQHLAALVKVCLCMSRRFLPQFPGWQDPAELQPWAGTPFFVPRAAQSWFTEHASTPRCGALHLAGANGSLAHLILTETDTSIAFAIPGQGKPRLAQLSGLQIFVVSGSSFAELQKGMEDLRSLCENSADFSGSARQWHAEHHTESGIYPYSIALIGHDPAELGREINFAARGVPLAMEKNAEWQTPLGSYFTPAPQGRSGKIALVYPGAFNSYLGLGRDLFYMFPQLYSRVEELSANTSAIICEKKLYPRSLETPTKEEIQALEAGLIGDANSMLISGTSVAVLYTSLLQDIFNVRVEMGFGYSLGENSMMFAANIWNNGDFASTRVESSPTFRTALAGPQNTIRAFWGLPPAPSDFTAAAGQPLWANYLLMAPAERIQAALEKETHVYLTHINTPRQVVIGGDPQTCQRVIAAVGCTHLRMPFDYALHCDPVRPEYTGLYNLHHNPIHETPELQLYSAADYDRVPFQAENASDEIASRIAHALSSMLDFPRLVRRVYADGARVFIEVGAGSNCTRWVDDSLHGLPHLSVSANRQGVEDAVTLTRLFARLASHQVPFNFAPLFSRD